MTERLARQYETHLLGDKTLEDLPSAPAVSILATNVTLGTLTTFGPEGVTLDAASKELVKESRSPKIALAVAASSAFPGVFSPMRLTRKVLGGSESKILIEHDLSDGGIWDNLGADHLQRLRAERQLQLLVVSDAGSPLDLVAEKQTALDALARSADVFMKRLHDQDLERLGADSIKITLGEAVEPPIPGELPEQIRQELPLLRTDLDRFSDLEVDCLSRHGYSVARAKLKALALRDAPTTWSAVGGIDPNRYTDAGRRATDAEALRKGRARRLHIRDVPPGLLLLFLAFFLVWYAKQAYSSRARELTFAPHIVLTKLVPGQVNPILERVARDLDADHNGGPRWTVIISSNEDLPDDQDALLEVVGLSDVKVDVKAFRCFGLDQRSPSVGMLDLRSVSSETASVSSAATWRVLRHERLCVIACVVPQTRKAQDRRDVMESLTVKARALRKWWLPF